MGGGHSHQEPTDNGSRSSGSKNSLGLTQSEINGVRYIVSLVAADTATHCIQAHIKYFRQHPQHLECFCGRPRLREPKHYSPLKLSNDKQFADRALIHGLALLQVLRCSSGSDPSAMERLASGLAHAHSGMEFTNDILKDYADVLIDYLKSQFEVAMTPAVILSWRHFLYGLASAISASKVAPFDQNRPLRSLPSQPVDEKEKLIQDIRITMMHDHQAITRTAASLIQCCQRKILKSSPPVTHIAERKKAEHDVGKAEGTGKARVAQSQIKHNA